MSSAPAQGGDMFGYELRNCVYLAEEWRAPLAREEICSRNGCLVWLTCSGMSNSQRTSQSPSVTRRGVCSCRRRPCPC